MSAEQTSTFPKPPAPKPTGRTLVLFRRDQNAAGAMATLKNTTGQLVIDSREFSGSDVNSESRNLPDSTLFIDRLNIALVPQIDPSINKFSASEDVRQSRPEFYMYATSVMQKRYGAWVREGLRLLADMGGTGFLNDDEAVASASMLDGILSDTIEYTWGVRAVGADRTASTGREISVAVLDTGFAMDHPDFSAGGQIMFKDFVDPTSTALDRHGHGTHTAGTLAGPIASVLGRRYGCAPDVRLHIGKVLGDNGSGREGDILDGINWAIDQKCAVISMSISRPTARDEPPDPVYERTGQAAMDEGSLIIAAAGNESARDYGYVAPVGAPANVSTIVAVAAIDPKMRIAAFSCGGLNAGDLSGPGVSVYSSFPGPQLTSVLSGTSMACPHVAAVAALWAQSDPTLRGQKLRDAIVRSARALGAKSDFGAGLAQAPDGGLIA